MEGEEEDLRTHCLLNNKSFMPTTTNRLIFQFLLGGIVFASAAWIAGSNTISPKTQALMAVLPLGFLITMYESPGDDHRFAFGMNYLVLTLAMAIGVVVWVALQRSLMDRGMATAPHKYVPIASCMLTWILVVWMFYYFVLH